MVTYVNPAEVFNAALIRSGESPISQNDDSSYAELFRGAYEGVVEDALTRQHLKFAKKAHNLKLQGSTGRFPQYAYVLPNDYLLAQKVTRGEYDDRVWFEIESGKLLTQWKAENFWLHYTYRAKENVWPGDFTEAVVIILRSLIKAFDEDEVEAGRLRTDGENKLIDSIGRHRLAQSAPPHSPRSPLVGAWRGGRRHG